MSKKLDKIIMKKDIFVTLILFNLTIIVFLKKFIFKGNYINFDFSREDIIKIIVLIGITVILNLIVILFSKKDISPVKKFLIIAVFIGIGYIFISPLMKGIDEERHFLRIYTFFTNSETNQEGIFEVPSSFKNVTDGKNQEAMFFYHFNSKITDKLVNFDLKGAKIYTPLSYLPYILPVWILGILIKTNICTLILSTRFFGFLIYLLSSVYAIKTIPKRKDFMSLFCLMPIIISSGATVTADVLTNCSIIIFIATWYKLYLEKKQITKKDIILIIITGILTGCAKMVYALEFLLIFFLPKECFGDSKKKKYITISLIVGVVGIATSINAFFAAGAVDSSYESFKLQKEFVLENPIKFLAILGNNILSNYNFLYEFTTNYTLLQNIYSPKEIISFIYFIGLLISIFNDEEVDLKLNYKKIISIIIIGLVIISVIYTSLYLQWTSENYGVGGNEIYGIQSRYYIPVMLMFLVCLTSKKGILNINKNIPYYISLWVNITILINIMLIVV